MRLKTSPSTKLGIFNNAKKANKKYLKYSHIKKSKGVHALGVSSALSALAVLLALVAYTGVTHATDPTVVDVSGTISSSETWTPDNVYVLTGTVEIPSGVTVTIEGWYGR